MDIVVVPLSPTNWTELWALYERVFDATEGPNPTDLSHWTRGQWPLPSVTQKALEAGEFWGAFCSRDLDEDGVPRPGSSLVGAYLLNSDLSDMGGETDWEPLVPSEFCALHQLTVDPAYRRQGVAKRLVAAAIAETRERGCKALRLTTAPSNLPANRLYRSLGFTEHAWVPFDYGSIPIEPYGVPYQYRLDGQT